MDSGFQSVDMKIANDTKEKRHNSNSRLRELQAMVLEKVAYAINPKGYLYTNENIDKLLFERHISSKGLTKVRRGGGKLQTLKNVKMKMMRGL